MVLNVLWCAGAVPLRPHETTTTSSAGSSAPSSASGAASAPPHNNNNNNNNEEYVQFLEQLVGELSNVFAHWIHQNPPDASDLPDLSANLAQRYYRQHCSQGN